jgi:hypothetical protein
MRRRERSQPRGSFGEPLGHVKWKAAEIGQQPYAIARRNANPVALADLWEWYEWPGRTVTTDPYHRLIPRMIGLPRTIVHRRNLMKTVT